MNISKGVLLQFQKFVGAELIDSVLDVVRKEAEGCDCLQVPRKKGHRFIFSSFLSCAGDMIAETSFLDIGRNIKTMRPFFDVDVVINDDQ